MGQLNASGLKLILGSTSAQRKVVMESLGIPFDVMAADIDEKAIRFDDPERLTLTLAHAKADALQKRINEPAILITCDLVVVWNGVIREKPVDAAEAHRFLHGYETHPAETVAAVVVTNTETGQRAEGIDRARVYFTPIPESTIDALIAEAVIFTQAGAFSINDPLLKNYIQRIEGDRTGIMGLPKQLMIQLTQKVGGHIPA